MKHSVTHFVYTQIISIFFFLLPHNKAVFRPNIIMSNIKLDFPLIFKSRKSTEFLFQDIKEKSFPSK